MKSVGLSIGIDTDAMSDLTPQSVLTSPSGQRLPIFGLGTWKSTPNELEEALDAALEAGYRLIDTAYLYKNEEVIGRVLARWVNSGKLKREDIFVTTKLSIFSNDAKYARQALTKQLEALQLTYVDLYLIHNPVGVMPEMEGIPYDQWKDPKLDMNTDHEALCREMEKQVDAGLAKSIGLSNFNIKQMERILNIARIKPFNLQIELHVYLQCKAEQAFCKDKGMTITSYATLSSPGAPKQIINSSCTNPLEDPVVVTIANNHGKTPGQVLLRHCMQLGIAVIPKSTNPGRIKENIQSFDFTLSQSEIEELNALEKEEEGRRFNFYFFKGHPEFPYPK